MVLRSSELHPNLQYLNSMLTTHEAAKHLDLSYWHFMHLVEAGRIPGVRVVDRWLFSPADLNDYKRSKFGPLEDLARVALEDPDIGLTEKQSVICHYLIANERPSEIARKLQQSRQAVHSQISLIREKVTRKKTSPLISSESTTTRTTVPMIKRTPRTKRTQPSL